MGHLYLDAYHATKDEYYYRAAEQVAAALALAQHPSGGWNYIADFAGEKSLREWYDTIGKNGWRLEEFQHYYGNATFDDAGTAESAKFFLRMYLEKKDPKYKVTARQGDQVRPRQPVSDRRLAAAISRGAGRRTARDARLHVLCHVQ